MLLAMPVVWMSWYRILFTFTILSHPHPFLSFLPQVNALLHRIHPLIRLAHRIRRRSFLPCTVECSGGFGSAGDYHGGVGTWVGVFSDDDSEDVGEVWKEMEWDEGGCCFCAKVGGSGGRGIERGTGRAVHGDRGWCESSCGWGGLRWG